MKKFFLLASLFTFGLMAAPPMPIPPSNQKIFVQNAIVTQVHGTTISIMDVKKRMDMAFHQNFPQLAGSTPARFQFYQTSWQQACMELVDQELILADAEDREIKLTDGEVREELENRFGPNVMLTLDGLGIAYQEAWDMVRKEMLVQRMMWYFVHSKALQAVTPQDIRQGYRRYLKANPPYQEWTYQVLSIQSSQEDLLSPKSEEIYEELTKTASAPEDTFLSDLQKKHPELQISLSPSYTANHLKLSATHKEALEPLQPGEYSQPILQTSRSQKKPIARIFYVQKKQDFPAPSFEELANTIKNELLQKAMAKENETYLQRLRKHYGYNANNLQLDALQPFAIQ